MTLPQTYKQAVFKEQGAPLTLEDAQLTLPGKEEVLVKVEACGVCFSDMFAQNNIMGGGLYRSFKQPFEVRDRLIFECSPIVPGHEIIGHVAAVGEGASGWKVGDRIGGGWHGGHDGEAQHLSPRREKS